MFSPVSNVSPSLAKRSVRPTYFSISRNLGRNPENASLYFIQDKKRSNEANEIMKKRFFLLFKRMKENEQTFVTLHSLLL